MSGLCEISESPEPIKSKLKVGDFAIIKVFSADTKIFHRNFIGKICDGPDDDDDFEVTFMKRSEKIKDGFKFPEDKDAASVALKDIVRVLPKPFSVATTKRLSGIFKFKADLAHYGV